MSMKVSDIQRSFPKRMFGYDCEAVRVHLERLADLMSEKDRDVLRLKAELEAIKNDLGQKYRSEHVVADALLEAQSVAAKLKDESEAEYEATIEKARAEADRILAVAENEANARRAKAEGYALEAERYASNMRASIAEAIARARAAMQAGLETIGVTETWLSHDGGTGEQPQQLPVEESEVTESVDIACIEDDTVHIT